MWPKIKNIPSRNVNGMELVHMISTVKYEIMGYTKRQYEHTEVARRIYGNIGNPITENYKHILRQNIIKTSH